MWAVAVGPVVAASLALVFMRWKRTAVVLKGLHPPSSTAQIYGGVISTASGHQVTRDATGKLGAGTTPGGKAAAAEGGPAPALPCETRHTDETCHFIRRLAAAPVLRDAVAKTVESSAARQLSAQLARAKANSRGWISHVGCDVQVRSVVPDVVPISCDEETTGNQWIDIEAGVLCDASVAVDVEFHLLRNLSIPVSARVSSLRIAGAGLRCHTAGSAMGAVSVVDLPDIEFDLYTTVGHSGAVLSCRDSAVGPLVVEVAGRRLIRRLIGRVFREALHAGVALLLPESIRGPPTTTAAVPR